MFYLPRYIFGVSAAFALLLGILHWGFRPDLFSWYSIGLGLAALLFLFFIILYFLVVRTGWYRYLMNYRWWVNFHIYSAFLMWVLAAYHSGFRMSSPFAWIFWGATLLVLGTGVVGQYFFIKIPRSSSGLAESRNEIIEVAEQHALKLLKTAVDDPTLFAFLDKMDRFIRDTSFSQRRNLWGMIKNDLRIMWVKRAFTRELKKEQHDNPRLLEYQNQVLKRITIEIKIAHMSISRNLLRRWTYFHYAAVGYYLMVLGLHVWTKLMTTQFREMPVWHWGGG